MSPPLNTGITAILLLGGSGVRFSSPVPKQFHRIGGKPLFLYALQSFLKRQDFHQILLMIHPDWMTFVREELQILPQDTRLALLVAGKTRQETSFLALQACLSTTNYVVIHDGVRPFVDQDILQKNITNVLLYNAVDTCIPSADTLVEQEDEWIRSIPPREKWQRGQTPQSFAYSLIMRAHKQALQDGITNSSDDCSLVIRMGIPVKLVQGKESNIKITTELDLFVAERLLYRAFDSPFTATQSLKGKIFAVTGATGGIGTVLCHELQKQGATVVPISTSAKEFRTNLQNPSEVRDVFSKIADLHGPLDGLINSLGSFDTKDFFTLSEEEIEDSLSCNFTSLVYCCRWAKIKPGGHIINLSSSSYSRGRKDYPIYSAAKAAVVNFTQGLAEAMKDHHVHVLVPQRTDTKLRTKYYPQETKKTLLHPKEVVEKIIEVLCDTTLTGAIIEVRKKWEQEEKLISELSSLVKAESIPQLQG
ncbi:MAG: bifunctional cytidylyltransferase/SDR family oxidoreductase [Chlamydiae bacterium]|nr:bifunctional cytidylyltransferase/SDR family oxidoreductase [Chlamydiota bacterium]